MNYAFVLIKEKLLKRKRVLLLCHIDVHKKFVKLWTVNGYGNINGLLGTIYGLSFVEFHCLRPWSLQFSCGGCSKDE